MLGIGERLSKSEVKLAFRELGGVAVRQVVACRLVFENKKIEFERICQGIKRCVSNGTHSPVVFSTK